jgi:hypothetical protein
MSLEGIYIVFTFKIHYKYIEVLDVKLYRRPKEGVAGFAAQ